MSWEEVLKNDKDAPLRGSRKYRDWKRRKLDEPFNPFGITTSKKDEDGEMRSIAQKVLAIWRQTDWRTFMLDDIHKLPERFNSLSVEELEALKNKGKSRLKASGLTDKQKNEFERLMDKLIELKGSEKR